MAEEDDAFHRMKRRKREGHADFLGSSTPANHDDECRRKSVTPTTHHRPHDQDPKLLHYLDGHRIVRRSHTPFTSGGFCDVFVGDHQIYGKVAMRRPRMTEKGYTLSEMENFFTESEIWKKLHHPNILQFVGLIQSDGNIWAVSRFAENGSLPAYIKEHPEIDRRPFVLQLADAIRYLHCQTVVHGDVKGSNILVSAKGTVLLSDFGLSKPSGTSTNTSLSGAASIRWCAPELLFDEGTKTYASDVYSFGMTVYEILSGNIPFYTTTNDIHLLNAIKDDRDKRPPREPLASESGDSYEPLWGIASESWDGNPSNRPTMDAVCVRLGVPVQVTSSSGTTAEDTSIVENVALHSSGSTSAHVAEDAMRGFDQSVPGRVANYDTHNATIKQPNLGRGRKIPNPSMGTSLRLEWRMEEEYRKKQDDEKLIRDLPHAHARHDDTSTKPSRACHPNTRTELRQTIGNWIDDESSTYTLFWLCGEVGVGKTTVAHTIAKERDALHQLGASFFFNRDHPQRRDSLLFASTIAYQLARFDPEVYQAVVNTVQRNPDIVHRNIQEQLSQLVVEPLACIAESPSRIVLIVIDGLDECNDPIALLDILPLLNRHTGSRLRVLITSRPHADIVTKFKSSRLFHLTSQSHFRDINSRTLNNDVQAYLEWSLGEIASEFQHSLPSPWPTANQIKMLVDMASGLFILASLFDRYIRDPIEGNPSEQLARILSRRRSVGNSPTAELDLMYDLVLEDIKRPLSAKHVDFARNLLQLTFRSSKQLSVSEMADFLGQTSSDVLSVLKRGTSVLRLPDDGDGRIIPFHASFGEYIQDPERCSVKELVIERAPSHAELVPKFLEVFIRAARGGITGIEYDYSNSPPQNLTIADRELCHHVSLASNPIPPSCQQVGDKLYKDAVLLWSFIRYCNIQNDKDNEDRVLVKRIKKAGFATASHIHDEASIQHSLVKRILDEMPHLYIHHSFPNNRSDDATDEPFRIANEADLQQFKIKLQWSNSHWTVSYDDPRYFARLLWKWSKLQHHNILPLKGIDFDSFLRLSEKPLICTPLVSQYPDLKRSWYPSLLQAFQRRSEEAVQTILEIADSLQCLQESGFYASSMASWRVQSHPLIEDIVLSKDGKAMIHPLFVVYKDSVDHSPIDAERQSLSGRGLTHWRSNMLDEHAAKVVWAFGCVLYEVMTGIPPLKRYDDLVNGSKRIDDETTVHRLLDDLQASEGLKDVLRACWVIDKNKRPPIKNIITRLETILEGLRNQDGGARNVKHG